MTACSEVLAATQYDRVPVADGGEDGVTGVAKRPRPFRLYRRRWLMLAIFVLYSLCNACQWIQYSIVTNVVEQYYNVSSYAVDWMSIVYMITYCPLVLPATAFMDYMGLKRGMLAGAALTALGSWLKCAAVAPGRFPLALAGQTVVAVAQVFVLGVPPHLAASWFGSDEVVTACSLGVFGNMLGIACSFVATPLLVHSHEGMEEVGRDLSRLCYVTAGFATVVLILIATVFQGRPPLAPSPEAAARAPARPGCLAPLRRLLACPPFCLLMLVFAINVGTCSALSTLLNQLVLIYFKDGEELAGRLGFVFIVSAMVGSIGVAVVLDRTHRFKEATLAMFTLALLSMLAFTFTLPLRLPVPLYVASASLGCFLGGYMPVGLEFASELMYPESENTTAGVLMAGSQLMAVLFTVGYAWLLKAVGDVWANLAMSASLVLGAAFAVLIRPELKRREASLRATVAAVASAASAAEDSDIASSASTRSTDESPPASPASPASPAPFPVSHPSTVDAATAAVLPP